MDLDTGSSAMGGSGPTAANFSSSSQTISETTQKTNTQSAQYAYGAQLSGGDAATLNYNGSDYGIVEAGKQIFQSALDLAESSVMETSKAQQKQSEAALMSVDRALDLAEFSAAGDDGRLLRGILWLAAIAGGTFFGLAWLNSDKKKKAANA